MATKLELVKQHLIDKKEINSLEAIKLFGATRISAIIYELRNKGYAITTIPTKIKDKKGNECTFANYKLLKEPYAKNAKKIDHIIIEKSKVLGKSRSKKTASTLKRKLKHDKDLYYAYQSNIAMAYIDNEHWYCDKHKKTPAQLNENDKHIIANDAAKYFLDLLIK